MAEGNGIGRILGFAKAYGGGGNPADPEVIQNAVEDWLDDHPEATTTVEDGAITKAKLNADLQNTVDDVSALKNDFKLKGVA